MKSRNHGGFPELSPRELQLLQLAMEGHTDASIANHLEISEATVSTYWGRIRIKLGPYSRTELVAIFLQHENSRALEQLKQENDRLTREAGGEESIWQTILQNAPDAIFVVREDGTIESANDVAADLFGYEPDELRNMPVTQLMPERYRRAHEVHRKHYVSSPERKRMGEHMSTIALHKDGHEFAIAAALNMAQVSGVSLITCIVREAITPTFAEQPA